MEIHRSFFIESLLKRESPKRQLRAFKKSFANSRKPKNKCPSFVLYLPAVCKAGGISILLLIPIHCRWCSLDFYICRPCFRGQAYCSDGCRIEGRLKNRRKAQRKYRGTLKGKKAHCEAENRRRHGWSKKNQKNMDDPTTTVLPAWCINLLIFTQLLILRARAWFDRTGRCHFCGSWGQIVEEFPRRGYGSGA